MTASAAIAISAMYAANMTSSAVVAATSAPSAIGDSVSSGVWSFSGGVLGALVAFGIAVIQQRAQSKRERIKMAADSAGSHMANVAFDKYVLFCEEYAECAAKAFSTLLRYGPTEKILQNASDLYQIRLKWSLWVTSDTDTILERFEEAFREIGAKAGYTEATRRDPNATERQQALDEMYSKLAQVLGFKEWNGQKVSDELAQSTFVSALRRMLGTEQFDSLRRAVISHAVNELGRTPAPPQSD